MPQQSRKHQLQGTLIYHIYNRGISKHTIFAYDNDKKYFYSLLVRYTKKFPITIYHWCIMNNHYHLVLEISNPFLLSSVFAGIGRAYAHYHHQTYDTSGYLWEGRFKTQAIEKEQYLLRCGCYIEQNPVQAGIVKEAEQYYFSSARYYILGCNDALVTTNPYAHIFTSKQPGGYNRYKQLLSETPPSDTVLFDDIKTPLGSSKFIKHLVKRNGRLINKGTKHN